MSKRRDLSGRYAVKRSPKFVAVCWVGSVLSLALLYVLAKAVIADAASFRSCSANDAGITVVNCGKASVNFGDVLLIGLFILSAALTVSLFTAAWRVSQRVKS